MKFPGIRRKKGAGVIIVVTLLFLALAGGAMAASGGGHGEGETKHWEITDWARVLNFSILVIALFFVLKKPLSQALNSRIQGIKDQLEELEAQKVAAENKLAEYNKKLTQLDQEAEKIVSQYVEQGKQAKARILAEAEKTAEKLEEQARRNIEHEFTQAKQKLQAEAIEEALAKAEALIKEKITADDQGKLIDEYLEKVVA